MTDCMRQIFKKIKRNKVTPDLKLTFCDQSEGSKNSIRAPCAQTKCDKREAFTRIFYKNQIIFAEARCSHFFHNLRLECS